MPNSSTGLQSLGSSYDYVEGWLLHVLVTIGRTTASTFRLLIGIRHIRDGLQSLTITFVELLRYCTRPQGARARIWNGTNQARWAIFRNGAMELLYRIPFAVLEVRETVKQGLPCHPL